MTDEIYLGQIRRWLGGHAFYIHHIDQPENKCYYTYLDMDDWLPKANWGYIDSILQLSEWVNS